MTLSPTGKRVVESSGPLSASLVLVGDSPAYDDDGIPFSGKAGKQLNLALRKAGIDRNAVRLMHMVPVQAPGNDFYAHSSEDVDWGIARLRSDLAALSSATTVVTLGAEATETLLGTKPPVAQRGDGEKRESFISAWRGSVIPPHSVVINGPRAPENYLARLSFSNTLTVLPTFHPSDILRQMPWHPWLFQDIARAATIARHGVPATKYRKWFIQDPLALEYLVKQEPDLISFDTEMEPWVVGIATEDEVHVFIWSEDFRAPLEALLTSPHIVKVAHNWGHDYAFARKALKIKVARPYFDTQGGAHELNNALQKELSPHIATRFTNWAYHKWLTNHDQLIYCGMDAVVCFDAYWPMMAQLTQRGLYVPARVGATRPTDLSVTEFDHKLLTPLMEMQAVGFRVDEEERAGVEKELELTLDTQAAELAAMVEPIVEREIARFEKPHLFRVLRQCDCCGGGKTQRQHCELCALGMTIQAKGMKAEATGRGFKTLKAFKASWPACRNCDGSGKVVKKLPFNSDSSDQIADVIYRGLKVRPRKYKGNETVKAAQLDPLRDRHPVIARLVDLSKVRADYDTVARLRAGTDGLLHCVFDPFGTGSGRVAGKEGLLEVGTNPMNLPVAARRFVKARKGKILLYPDMAQIEGRALAMLSGDKNLIDGYTTPIDWPGNSKHGQIDSHTRVVQLMLGSGAQITRQQAKRLVYAIMNGGRAPQLTVELNAEAFRNNDPQRLTTAQVQYMIDVFYRVFHGVKTWQDSIQQEVLETRRFKNPLTGREFTWLGYIVETRKKNENYGGLKYEIAKQVFARGPQDTAAWVLGLGLIDMYYNSDHWGDLLQPLIHVHDALLIEAPIEREQEAKDAAMKHLTRDAFGISFPAEMKSGYNWLEASGGV